MLLKNLYLISNDKIWLSKKKFTSNNDLNSIISCLAKNYKIYLLNRKSKNKLSFPIKEKFTFLKVNKIEEKKINLLLVSITPYNFLTLLKMIYFKNLKIKGYVYLRSDGFLEYKYRYGIFGYFLYYIMFRFIIKNLKILSCSKKFTNVNVKKIVHPSELNSMWFKNNRIQKKIKTDFLYVGRFKKDKGSIYLSDLFKNDFKNYKLTIVGTKKKNIDKKYYSKNISYIGAISKIQNLIDIYDSTKIFILPSYIEGFPKVISESLARLKPIIIFEDIKYVVNQRDGIFVCKRNLVSLKKNIDYINKNYKRIQNKIKKNFFYTKENFKNELLNYIQDELKY